MDKQIEKLIKYNAQVLYGKKPIKAEEIEADVIERNTEIVKLANTITDTITNIGFILEEDIKLFNEKQTNCMRELNELLDKIKQY